MTRKACLKSLYQVQALPFFGAPPNRLVISSSRPRSPPCRFRPLVVECGVGGSEADWFFRASDRLGQRSAAGGAVDLQQASRVPFQIRRCCQRG